MSRTLLLAVAAGAAIAFMALDAQAFPVTSSKRFGVTSDVTQIAGGCGYGWHRGPWGGCRRNWRPLPGRGVRCWFRRTPWGPRRVCRW